MLEGIVVARFSLGLYPSWRDGAEENLGTDVGHCHDTMCVILVIKMMDL